MAYRGRYTPQNPRKYTGDPSNVIYRSLWERKFMTYCDQRNSIVTIESRAGDEMSQRFLHFVSLQDFVLFYDVQFWLSIFGNTFLYNVILTIFKNKEVFSNGIFYN